MEQETQKSYTITSDSRGVWGPRNSGVLLSPFLPHQLFPIQSEWQPEKWVAGQERSLYASHPRTCTPSNSSDILIGPNVWPIRICERAREDYKPCSLEQLVLTLTLHNQQVAFSKIQAKLLITRLKMLANCNPLPPHIRESVLLLLIKQVPGYWALGRQRFLCSFSLLNHLPQRSSTWIPCEEPATPALL